MEPDFKIAVQAGVTSNEFVRLMAAFDMNPVPSRMSAFHWFREHRQPSKEYRESTGELLNALYNAISTEALPLPINVKRADRLQMLINAIQPHINL